MAKVSRRWKPKLTDYMTDRVFSLKVDGKHPLELNKEVSFKGERGRFRFKWARQRADGSWDVTVFGGTKRYQAFRTFPADRIKSVHYKEKLRKK